MTDLELTLWRFAYTSEATLGVLDLGLYTVERPWQENRPFESSIPEGSYTCRPRFFHRGGYLAVEVQGVPDRTHILFHRGNTAEDVQGCIAVGMRLGVLKGRLAVLDSHAAWRTFLLGRAEESFPLTIRRLDPVPEPPAMFRVEKGDKT